MGSKGAKLTSDASISAEDIQNRLAEIGEIRTKKMFSGYGVFEEDKMFALIDSSGRIFFKVDDTNRARFEEAGSEKHARMPYFSVPGEVLDDDELLVEWARLSIRISKGGK
jgi:DNA transformation protein